jgi:hypothetical protein
VATAGALPRQPAGVRALLRDCCGRKGRWLSSVLPVDFATGTKSNTVCCTCKPAAAAAAARLHAGGRPVTSRRVASRRVAGRRVASPLFATAAAQSRPSGAALRQRVDLWRATASTCQRGDAAA